MLNRVYRVGRTASWPYSLEPHKCKLQQLILFTQRPIPEMFVRKFLELAVQKISVFLNRPFCTFYQNIFLYLIANQSKGRIDGTQFWFQPRMTNFGGIGVIVKTLYWVFKILVVIISLIISSHPYCIFIFWFRLW